MPGDPYQKVTTGQPFQPAAGVWNDFLDTTAAFKRQRFGQGARELNLALPTSVLLRVLNDTGQAIPPRSVLGIGAPVFEPAAAPDSFEHEAMVTGVLPTDDHAGAYLVTSNYLPVNAFGRGVLLGATWCQVLIHHARHRFAEVLDGQTYLQSAVGGSARILWAAGTSGVQWAIVLLGAREQIVRGKTDGPINKDSTGTVRIYDHTEDTGQTITAFNDYADLETDKWTVAALIGGLWFLIAGECS